MREIYEERGDYFCLTCKININTISVEMNHLEVNGIWKIRIDESIGWGGFMHGKWND